MLVSNDIIEVITKAVLDYYKKDTFAKQMDSSGIIKVITPTVKCEPFSDTKGVFLKDILSLDEAPRMGAGIMELNDTSFEWTLTYDEYDYVISGELIIEIDGRDIVANEGDIVYIPRGSHIFFKTPSHARYAYFVYPADWQNQ